ncbi:hypothetical protein GWN26_13275 [Candidatus Saccharibacteria bacterium]|nr:hypothetical protein [Calditrichia bacterium]NIV71896.1 hypothetical protein [Calditrichia bacterium]NIW00031.1 hypothetical protein [Candidatus Saccharibacteria bacterium]NIW79772.1 hypothetical protein [Calditrichia bacterium]
MNNSITVDSGDLEKVKNEIDQMQTRVIQILVPTILGFGLIAIADPQSIRDITMGCAFAILFSSSLFVTALSYKIFRNASFLQIFAKAESTRETVYWEDALSDFRKKGGVPRIVHSETTAVATIYAVMAFTYFFMFYRISLVAAAVLSLILLIVAIRMFLLYQNLEKFDNTWKKVKKGIIKQPNK